MAALGAIGGDEGVRSLLGNVDLFIVDKKSSYRGECRCISTRMRTRRESRKVAEELLAVMEECEMKCLTYTKYFRFMHQRFYMADVHKTQPCHINPIQSLIS